MRLLGAVLLCSVLVVALPGPSGSAPDRAAAQLQRVQRFIVVYQENHSFDNLYGSWEGVNGINRAPLRQSRQIDGDGNPFTCLLQNQPKLGSPPLTKICSGEDAKGKTFASHFRNAPFNIFRYIPPTAQTCHQGRKGGCTQDIVHNFYQLQYQMNGGRMNRFAVGSNAVGLTVGHYSTRQLPIYKFLHRPSHPRYAVADRFFQAAFGGSFLNHMWLVSARTPIWPNAVNNGGEHDLHSAVDANGMPRTYPDTPMYISSLGNRLVDGDLSASCDPPASRPKTPPGILCGNWVVNTTSPQFQPHRPGPADGELVPPQKAPTIGTRLSARGISWAWYSQGWSNAAGRVGTPGWTNGSGPKPGTDGDCQAEGTAAGAKWPYCLDNAFVDHHQPFNYFAAFSPRTPAGRAARATHLRDLVAFDRALTASSEGACRLPKVSFVKLMGENEHPGDNKLKYKGEHAGNLAVTALLRRIVSSTSCTRGAMIVFAYDEFGGAWDHLAPPGQGRGGVHDKFGPGPRVPVIVLSPLLQKRFAVDHVEHDTTSIIATIEHRFGLRPVSSRDARVKDLSSVFAAGR
jgi:acid phosphatase